MDRLMGKFKPVKITSIEDLEGDIDATRQYKRVMVGKQEIGRIIQHGVEYPTFQANYGFPVSSLEEAVGECFILWARKNKLHKDVSLSWDNPAREL